MHARQVAVRRAIIRRLLTGRGVPVRDQLRSHALFARNFRAFACCFDTVGFGLGGVCGFWCMGVWGCCLGGWLWMCSNEPTNTNTNTINQTKKKQVVLYDNNRRQAATTSSGAGGSSIGGGGGGNGPGEVALLDPRVIARKEMADAELRVVDAEAFRAFQVGGIGIWGWWNGGCGF